MPLRPGTYALTLALFDQGNNLAGGKLVDSWEAMPYLLVDDEIHSHPQDLYAGVMNIPMGVDIADITIEGGSPPS